MNKKFWLRGLALGLGVSGFSGTSYGQAYPYGQGLAPNAYPPHPSLVQQGTTPITIGTYPSLAQNTPPSPGHVHVPQGTYTTAEQFQNLVPQLVDPRMQVNPTPAAPAHITPLPPVQNSAPAYMQPSPNPSQSTALPQTISPMYAVPAQNAPATQPLPTTGTITPHADQLSGSCSTCNSSTQIQSAPGVGHCAAPMYMTRAVAPNPWIFGASGLIFNRDDNESVRLTSNVANSMPTVLNTLDAQMQTAGGFEVFGGRYFGCGRYAIIGSYWGLFPGDQSRTVYDPELDTSVGDSIRSDLDFTIRGPGGGVGSEHGIEMPGGANVAGPNGGRTGYAWYDNVYAHRLTRSQDFHNLEFNLFSFALGGAARNGVAKVGCGTDCESGWGNGQHGRADCSSSCGAPCQTSVTPCSGPTGACAPMTGAQCSRLRFSWLGGVRWLRINDYMEYASSDTDAVFGAGADDFYYRNTVRNDLLGLQLGGMANYCTGHRVNLYAISKFGVFGNRINFDSYAGTATDAAIVSSYNSYDNQEYDLMATRTDLAFVGEGELGLGIRVTQGLVATCGYRVIGASGIATAPGQIPYDFSLLDDARTIQNDRSLILHGLSVGGMYNW